MADSFRKLSNDSRVWIYMADRFLTGQEIEDIREKLELFTESWTSHNRNLEARGDILYNRFLVLMVDESSADASGCSIDASVHFLYELGKEHEIDWFDRQQFAVIDESKNVKVYNKYEFEHAYQSEEIRPDTLVFDNLVDKKSAWAESWIKPIKKSWHHRLLS